MKLNWGFSIALFYIVFMSVLLYFVIKSTTYDNSLVMENYYEQDLKYQSHFDKMVNTQNMSEKVNIINNHKEGQIELQFPETMKMSTGSVHFFCPQTKHKDLKVDLKLDQDGLMKINSGQFTSGRWKVKLDWEDNGKSFYTETELIL